MVALKAAFSSLALLGLLSCVFSFSHRFSAALTLDLKSPPTPADDVATETIHDCDNYTRAHTALMLWFSTPPLDSGILT